MKRFISLMLAVIMVLTSANFVVFANEYDAAAANEKVTYDEFYGEDLMQAPAQTSGVVAFGSIEPVINIRFWDVDMTLPAGPAREGDPGWAVEVPERVLLVDEYIGINFHVTDYDDMELLDAHFMVVELLNAPVGADATFMIHLSDHNLLSGIPGHNQIGSANNTGALPGGALTDTPGGPHPLNAPWGGTRLRFAGDMPGNYEFEVRLYSVTPDALGNLVEANMQYVTSETFTMVVRAQTADLDIRFWDVDVTLPVGPARENDPGWAVEVSNRLLAVNEYIGINFHVTEYSEMLVQDAHFLVVELLSAPTGANTTLMLHLSDWDLLSGIPGHNQIGSANNTGALPGGTLTDTVGGLLGGPHPTNAPWGGSRLRFAGDTPGEYEFMVTLYRVAPDALGNLIEANMEPVTSETFVMEVTALAVTPNPLTIDNDSLTATATVTGGTGPIIWHTITAPPPGITVTQAMGVFTITGVRPAHNQPAINEEIRIRIVRGDLYYEYLTIHVNLTPEPEVLTVSPNPITIDNNNLTTTVTVTGGAGQVYLYSVTPPPGVLYGVEIDPVTGDATITLMGVRPAHNQSAIVLAGVEVRVVRGGLYYEYLILNVNLTPLPADAPTTQPGGGGGGGLFVTNRPRTVQPAAQPESQVIHQNEPESGRFFYDVPSGSWFYGYINFVYENDLMEGLPGNLFEPNQPLTRAMVATVLWRLEGSPYVPFTPVFSDVPAQQWFSTAVIWAAENNIVLGFGDGTFGPHQSITREQLAAMIWRAANYLELNLNVSDGFDLSSFIDVADISDWAFDYKLWAAYNGIIGGRTESTLIPQGTATRAEFAAVLQRFITSFNL